VNECVSDGVMSEWLLFPGAASGLCAALSCVQLLVIQPI
jgi:hypothetical protein